MPAAVSSNAVAALRNGLEVYSLMGMGPKKTWDDVSNKVYVLHAPEREVEPEARAVRASPVAWAPPPSGRRDTYISLAALS